MQIKIKAFAHVKEILGADNFIECADGSSMQSLLNRIRHTSAKVEDELFMKNGNLKEHLILMHNGTRIYKEDVEALILSDGDEIALFPPVSGG
jgi:molybdopterin synthase sulfur carrier subunit